jgi:hypothetical protein
VDDVIEYGGDAANKYVRQLLPVFVQNFKSNHTVLRQSAIYGVAQCLRVCPDECFPSVSMLVPALLSISNVSPTPAADDGDEDDDFEGSRENALFALGLCVCNEKFRSCGSWGHGVEAKQVAADFKVGHSSSDSLRLCLAGSHDMVDWVALEGR